MEAYEGYIGWNRVRKAPEYIQNSRGEEKVSETHYSWQACDLQGNVVEVITDKPMPLFDCGTILECRFYTREQYRARMNAILGDTQTCGQNTPQSQ